MPSLPDLEAWAIFARVADLGSFTRAASELGLSKATVSKALARLEARLGAALFHRTSRRLALTDTGAASLERARRILLEGEAAESEAGQGGTPRGLVRVAAPVSFGVSHVAPLLPDFLQRFPGVSVDLRLSDRLSDLVADGMDLAVRIGVLADSRLRARALFPMHLLPVAAPAYLARHGTPAHPDELARHAAILFTQRRAPDLWRFQHATLGETAVRVAARLFLDNAEAALPALRAGVALTLLPDFVAGPALRDGGLVAVLPGWTVPSGAVHLVTPPGRMRPARVTALLEFLAAELRAGRPDSPE